MGCHAGRHVGWKYEAWHSSYIVPPLHTPSHSAPSPGTGAQHEYKYLHGYLWVNPWENLYIQITCVQVPGA